MPSPADFYARFWNRQPFLVRAAINEADISALIAADELAALAMEEAPQSRMIETAGDSNDWACLFGPFEEQDFAAAGDADWSLLVQNVEQFHPDTAHLLRHFDFAPRWLMDDIMVGFSAPGGSVGPHIDSYHVFLTQGQGRRRWKIGREAITDPQFIEGIDLKILKDGFDGDEVQVGCGDVLYIPPNFGHEGTTLEASLTFSVGFLGPKLSQLFSAYGQYLSELDDADPRYVGDGLSSDSAGGTIADSAVDTLRADLAAQLGSKDFAQWLVEFFTESSHEDFGAYTEREDALPADAFAAQLREGATLVKPQYVKFAITHSADGAFYLGFDNHSFTLNEGLLPLVQGLMQGGAVDAASQPQLLAKPAVVEFLRELYNHQALEFA